MPSGTKHEYKGDKPEHSIRQQWFFTHKQRRLNTFYFHLRITALFVHIRRAEVCPLLWYQSAGVELPKPTGGWRWVHLMDPLSKHWHTSIMAKTDTGTTNEHGFYRHRSRTSAIMVVVIASYRMEAAGLSHNRDQYDLKNACSSISHDTLKTVTDGSTEYEGDAIFGRQRYALACFEIRCHDGTAVMLLLQGVQAGDPYKVALFRRGFRLIVQDVQSQHIRNSDHAKLLLVKSPRGILTDVSLTSFADDSCRQYVLALQNKSKQKRLLAQPWFEHTDVSTETKQSAYRRYNTIRKTIPRFSEPREMVVHTRRRVKHFSQMYDKVLLKHEMLQNTTKK